MSTTGVRQDEMSGTVDLTSVDMKVEVIVIPVADVDRAKAFYLRLGWRLDRTPPAVVQFTPHGSACSVQFGTNLTEAAPGSAEEYLVVSSAATTERDKDHLRRHVPEGLHAEVVDLTSAYAVFGVMGPCSRELLSRLSRADLGEDAFPFGASREIDLGYSTVRATRITYVGELGWELYTPTELAVGVYEDLMRAGADLGVRNGGYSAIESMRLEKGYRAFGRELTPDDGPEAAGLLFTCKLGTDLPFLGREAVEAARAAGPRRRLVSFALEDPDVMLWGGELVLRDGRTSGRVTSAAWGASVGASVGLAYLWDADGRRVDAAWVGDGRYEVAARSSSIRERT